MGPQPMNGAAPEEPRRAHEVKPSDLRPHPSQYGWTTPRSWGVWELPVDASGKRYRYGNNPIRGQELENEFGRVRLVALYTQRDAAKEHADALNS